MGDAIVFLGIALFFIVLLVVMLLAGRKHYFITIICFGLLLVSMPLLGGLVVNNINPCELVVVGYDSVTGVYTHDWVCVSNENNLGYSVLRITNWYMYLGLAYMTLSLLFYVLEQRKK